MKRKFVCTIAICLSFLFCGSSVFAIVDRGSSDSPWAKVDLKLDCSYPEDFANDVIVTFTNDRVKRKVTLFEVNSHVINFQMPEGEYQVDVAIEGGNSLLYLAEYPETYTQTAVVSDNVFTVTIVDNIEVINETYPTEEGTKIVEEKRKKKEEEERKMAKEEKDAVVEKHGRSLLGIVGTAVLTAGGLAIAYIVLRKRFE